VRENNMGNTTTVWRFRIFCANSSRPLPTTGPCWPKFAPIKSRWRTIAPPWWCRAPVTSACANPSGGGVTVCGTWVRGRASREACASAEHQIHTKSC
jgi:hypothetical protein